MKFLSAKSVCLTLILSLSLFFGGCGGGGGGGASTPTTSVSGSVFAGPVQGSVVTIKTVTGDVVAGPVTTASDGSYTIAIPTASLNSDLVFEATGGLFPDEATGTSSVTFGTLSAHIPSGTLAGAANVTIDPASTIIRKLVAAGMTRAAADAAFFTAFGYAPDVSVKPAFANVSCAATGTQRLCGLRAAAFSQLTKDLGLTPEKQFEVIQSLAEDLSDGILDGKKNGVAVTTTSGTALPGNVAGLYSKSFANFLTGTMNRSKLTSATYNTRYLTPSYQVEYLPGMMAATQGKASFKIRVTNRTDGSPATGKTLTLMPKMNMATMSHSSPTDPVVESSTPGTYDCTAYFLMASGAGMGFWELKVMIGMESAYFYPQVGMTMGPATWRATLKGVADSYPGMSGAAKRTYYLFPDGLSHVSGSYTFKLFIATLDDSMMMSYPALSVGTLLHDQNNAGWSVTTMTVEASTDNGANWVSATQGSGNGHWSFTGLTGLSAGSNATVLIRLSVNGEQKSTDGNAASGSNGYATFTLTP